MSGLAQVAINTARERHPRVELIFKSLDTAKEVNAPQLALARLEAKRLERNCYLDIEACFVNDALRLQQQIDAEVFAAAFRDDAVALDSEWIEKDLKGFSFVVESVEHEPDVIVVEDVVALGDGGAHFVGIVCRFESNVEKLRIEPD